MEERSYLGKGIKYPHEVNSLGRVDLISGTDLVAQSIKILLQTDQGADFDNPTRGSRLKLCLWEQNDDILESLIDFYIFEAIEAFEKRVTFIDTEFSYIESKPELVNVKVTYRIKATNEIDSFIYPFYRELTS